MRHILIILGVLLLIGCENLDVSKLSEDDINKVIVCDSPYIRHGPACCLDQNSNGLCDDDEKKEPIREVKVQVPEPKPEPKPRIQEKPRVTEPEQFKFTAKLYRIKSYTSGPMGASGNIINGEYFVNGNEVTLDELCPDFSACKFYLRVDGFNQKQIGRFPTGNLFYPCNEGDCLENEYPSEHVYALILEKDGERHSGGSYTLRVS